MKSIFNFKLPEMVQKKNILLLKAIATHVCDTKTTK